MMPAGVLVDTGPLVALLSHRDARHDVCAEQLREIVPPLMTCWPVITEAAWLLRRKPAAVEGLLGGFNTGLLRLGVLEEDAVPHIADFLRRYRSVGAQLADAVLVYLAEREGIETIFTLDRRDFSIYRKRDGSGFRLLAP
jgi:uncharacterized protein